MISPFSTSSLVLPLSLFILLCLLLAAQVSSVVGRAELMCAIFYLLSFLCYARGALKTSGRTDWKRLTLSIFLTLCSLLSKEQGITSIGVCVAYDVLLHWKHLWRGKSNSSLLQSVPNGNSLAETNHKEPTSCSWQSQPEQKRVLQMGERVCKFAMFSGAPYRTLK